MRIIGCPVESRIQYISKNWSGLVIQGAIALAALAGVVYLQLSQNPLSTKQAKLGENTPSTGLQEAVEQEELRLKLIEGVPTFGFDNLIADWTFLKFLQYFGDDEARSVTGYELGQEYFDVITKRDPRWVDIYPFLSTTISFYQAKPEVSVELMDRGTNALSPEINPKAWQLWRFKGLDQLLLLGDTPGAIQSHEMAAEWLEGTPDAHLIPVFRETIQYLRQNPDSIFVRFNAWLSVYGASTDKLVRERAKQEILKLGGQIQTGENGELKFRLSPDQIPDQIKNKK